MLIPRLTGYPVDRTVVQQRQRERRERRARKLADRPVSRWASTRLPRT
jgi:hypothetical protein